MTKREIITLAKGLVKDWLTYKDESDKDYLLDILKTGDLDDFFAQVQIIELVHEEQRSWITDLEDEWLSICD